jgi:hypothetical protein
MAYSDKNVNCVYPADATQYMTRFDNCVTKALPRNREIREYFSTVELKKRFGISWSSTENPYTYYG